MHNNVRMEDAVVCPQIWTHYYNADLNLLYVNKPEKMSIN